MTLNDKLDHFYTSVIDSATAQCAAIIDDYRKSLQKVSDERRSAAVKKAENTFKSGSDAIKREKNRKLSDVTLDVRRKITDRTAEITEQIFLEVRQKLEAFMKTPEYMDYMCRKIKAANTFAPGSVMIIYINPTDEGIKKDLEERTGSSLTVSDRDFIGGIRAVIPSRSILIDDSFLTRLAEEKNSFKLL